jgi:hypothetical protein
LKATLDEPNVAKDSVRILSQKYYQKVKGSDTWDSYKKLTVCELNSRFS